MDDFWIDRWPEIVRVAMYRGASLVSLQGWERRRKIPGDWAIRLHQAAPEFGQEFPLSELSTTSRGKSDPDTGNPPLEALATRG